MPSEGAGRAPRAASERRDQGETNRPPDAGLRGELKTTVRSETQRPPRRAHPEPSPNLAM
eukprot:14334423-Alexandrium_andersonii.AAC.1